MLRTATTTAARPLLTLRAARPLASRVAMQPWTRKYSPIAGDLDHPTSQELLEPSELTPLAGAAPAELIDAPVERVFISPSRYVQGSFILSRAGRFVNKVAKKHVAIISDTFVWNLAGKDLAAALTAAGYETVFHVEFNGESSFTEIKRISTDTADAVPGCEAIIGIGGGKTMDTAKAVADLMGLRTVIIPTTASTDAPTSAVSVIYNDKGIFEQYKFYDRNPDLVMVDTALLCKAPPRFLSSGIADALATWVEAAPAIRADSINMAGGRTTLVGSAIGMRCEETLFKFGLLGLEANRANVVTPAFEAVVEANTLMSGLGFESGGLGIGHAVHNGFTALHGPVHSLLHGEKVAFGILVQLVAEQKTREELERYLQFLIDCDLPTTLEELHLGSATDEELMAVAKTAVKENESAHNMPYRVTAIMVYDAIKGADMYARMYKERKGITKRFGF